MVDRPTAQLWPIATDVEDPPTVAGRASSTLPRDRFTSPDDEATHDLDPNWKRQFQLSVANTQVRLEATCSGPQMLLADVSRLRVGSLLEFDEANLQKVSVEIAGNRIFVGRLGRSRGYFTICLQTPAEKFRSNDGDNPFT